MLVHEKGLLIIIGDIGVNNHTQQANPLKAYVNNGNLYVSGLNAGKVWNVYSPLGAIIYQSIATSDKEETFLTARGIYFIQSENKTVKVVY